RSLCRSQTTSAGRSRASTSSPTNASRFRCAITATDTLGSLAKVDLEGQEVAVRQAESVPELDRGDDLERVRAMATAGRVHGVARDASGGRRPEPVGPRPTTDQARPVHDRGAEVDPPLEAQDQGPGERLVPELAAGA